MTDDDWRLMGQERYLSRAEFRRAAWSPHEEGWDHDHCAFCQGEFSAEKSDHVDFTSGFVTTDGRHEWVCEACFEDLRGLADGVLDRRRDGTQDPGFQGHHTFDWWREPWIRETP